MEGKKFSTPLADFHVKNGVVHSKMLPVTATLERAQEHVRMIKEELRDMVPFVGLADISLADRSASKAVRDCLNDKEMEKMSSATAILSDSFLTRTVGSLFVRFSKVQTPVVFFSNESEALKWLEQYKKN
jgi:hypothetical protein